MRESEIEAHLVKRVKERGGIAYKFTSLNRRSVPDRICAMPGNVIIFCELKRPGEKPTEAQAREHQRLRDLGCKVLVLDTKQAVDHWFGSDCKYFDLK